MWSSQLRWLFAALLFSYLGTAVAPVALVFAVLHMDASASGLGVVLASRTIPLVVFLLIGGVVADRFRRGHVLVVSHCVGGLAQGAAAWLLISGNADVGTLASLQVVGGAAAAFTVPATNGVIPQIVPTAHLQRANALLGATRHGTVIIGPSIAAGLIVTVGPGWGLAADAVCYLIAALFLTRLRLPPSSQKSSVDPCSNADGDGVDARVERSSFITDLREGWSVFAGRRWLWTVVTAFAFFNMAYACAVTTLGPVVATRTFGEVAWSVAMSVEAVGFLAASALLFWVRLSRPLPVGVMAMAGAIPPMLVLGAQPQAGLFIAVCLVAGFALELFSVGWMTGLHQHVPPAALSRVSSYDALGSLVAVPVGQLLAGPLSATVGLRGTILGCAAVGAIAALSPLASREVRTLRAPGSAARARPSESPQQDPV